jgi:endonuclease/exonuclease/phosphatase family metal-dependent hydrolase
MVAVVCGGCNPKSPRPRAKGDPGPAATTGKSASEGAGSLAKSPQPPATDLSLPASDQLKLLHWNIESGGSRPGLIADQLLQLVGEGGYHVLALSEVDQYEVYLKKLQSQGEPGRWEMILGASGINEEREDDRLMILFDSRRLSLIQSQELNRYREFRLNSGRHRSPLVAHFECRQSGNQFLLIHNHLARGDAEFRAEQAAGLREYARDTTLAKLAVGDFNFDYVFETGQGNEGFNEFMRDGIWRWVQPDELIDTNWFDPEPDGLDNYPGSLLDFTFVAGPARDWQVTSRVIVREGDFPDDRTTSDHRPVEVVISF